MYLVSVYKRCQGSSLTSVHIGHSVYWQRYGKGADRDTQEIHCLGDSCLYIECSISDDYICVRCII